ncbi:hypothetical protein ID263_004916, partial [Escherichia coli]|nr:hypothetical protein [Escherichia coli]EGH0606624.1 hypothetical protein [Escherichia coli]
MAINFNILVSSGNMDSFRSVKLNESRIGRMSGANHDEAVYMGFWDKFCDLFRPEKKKDVLESVWALLHPKSEGNDVPPEPGSRDELRCMLSAFRTLRSYAECRHASDFGINITSDWSGGCCKLTTTFTIRNNPVRSQ